MIFSEPKLTATYYFKLSANFTRRPFVHNFKKKLKTFVAAKLVYQEDLDPLLYRQESHLSKFQLMRINGSVCFCMLYSAVYSMTD